MNKNFYIQQYTIWEETPDEKLPCIDFIPPLQRRRLTDVEKIGFYLAHQIKPDLKDCKIVFASRFGEWQQTLQLIEEFHQEKQLSPAGFSHSVHNAMPGLLSVFAEATNNYTTIAAGERTIDNALIETFTSDQDVLFIFAEEKAPSLYQSILEKPTKSHGVAFVVSDKPASSSLKIDVKSDFSESNPTTFDDLCCFLKNGQSLKTPYLDIKNAKN